MIGRNKKGVGIQPRPLNTHTGKNYFTRLILLKPVFFPLVTFMV